MYALLTLLQPNLKHAIERVERPGGSHEGIERKKKDFKAQRPTGTREALLSEAGFENVFWTQNWARRRKLFCR